MDKKIALLSLALLVGCASTQAPVPAPGLKPAKEKSTGAAGDWQGTTKCLGLTIETHMRLERNGNRLEGILVESWKYPSGTVQSGSYSIVGHTGAGGKIWLESDFMIHGPKSMKEAIQPVVSMAGALDGDTLRLRYSGFRQKCTMEKPDTLYRF